MKRILTITCMLLFITTITAQTNVEKVVPSKATGDGIIYSLPKTSFIINAEVTKITVKAGAYYRYAELYLGLKDVATEDAVYYELGKVTLTNKGVPDPENTYKIEFKQKTVAPFVYLTRDGLLCSINEVYVPEFVDEERRAAEPVTPSSSKSIFTEELLRAGSIAKQAEVAAKQIYRLRESRTDIITGEADNLPPDGEAMKLVINQLEVQEKAYMHLFTGTESREYQYYDVTIIPEGELEKEVIFRFSRKMGILDADDLGGEPVYLNLKSLERIPEPDLKTIEKKDKIMKGVVFNIPGRARAEIIYNNKSLLKKETPVVQFGSRNVLLPVLLEDKKQPIKVVFYPETGAIKQTIP